MKKILALVAALSVVMSLVAGGSIAYLTDTEKATNTMTMGNVEITQNEYKDSDLTEDFVDTDLYPGQTIGKYVTVTNTGKSPAHVRTFVAFEKGTNNNWKNVIQYTKNDTDWTWSNSSYSITVEGVNYEVFVADYKEALNATDPDTRTPASLYTVSMNASATNDDVAAFDGAYTVLVLSQAVQTAGFNGAAEAFATAFQGGADKPLSDAMIQEWFGGEATPPTPPQPNGDEIEVEGTDKAAVLAAIENAKDGDIITLTEDTTIAGYNATEKLTIDKAITLDLNGKTLTTESGWGGIDLKGGASIVNGTINHTGNTAAIKAFQVGKIENVTINVTETAGKTKGGIVVQEGAGCYVGSIKNVTINGATNGIETYRCGDRTDKAIGSMENVKINATDTGIQLSAPIGTVTNCEIKGGNIGINAYLYGPYSVTMDLVNTKVEGANAGLYAHDEVGKTNPGSLAITYDAASNISKITEEFEAEVSGRASVTLK